MKRHFNIFLTKPFYPFAKSRRGIAISLGKSRVYPEVGYMCFFIFSSIGVNFTPSGVVRVKEMHQSVTSLNSYCNADRNGGNVKTITDKEM